MISPPRFSEFGDILCEGTFVLLAAPPRSMELYSSWMFWGKVSFCPRSGGEKKSLGVVGLCFSCLVFRKLSCGNFLTGCDI